ncbi:MAG: hypothetical protein Q8L14_32060 [Myxococcales bacterium]|nr:hypothetical protein [Myxococcales bacterium]
MKTFIRLAKQLPDVEEGIACKGTALESRTFKANSKAFLFLNAKDARLKLGASLGEASAFAARAPGRCTVGAGGWVKLSVAAPPAPDVLARWITESRAAVGKPSTTKGAPRAAKKKRARAPARRR